MDKLFFSLRESLIEFPNGVIIGLGRLELIRNGWVVKIKGATDFQGQDGMISAIHLAQQTTRKIAGAKDDDVELWDVIEVFEDESEATEFGYENDNLFIYQIETGRLKWLD